MLGRKKNSKTRDRPGIARGPKHDDMRGSIFTRRALLVATGQIAALGALGTRLYQVQVGQSDRYTSLADSNRISARLIAPPRARILDRFGVPVANNHTNWRALIVAEETDDVSATLRAFSALVPLEERDIARIERDIHRHRRFIPVTIRDFLSWEEMARIEVNAPDLPGVVVDVGQTRLYPFGPDLAHVVGYVAPPSEADVQDRPILSLPGMRIGKSGMEKCHDDVLRGEAGSVQLEVNSVGRVIRELNREEGTPGAELGLTIDVELQKQVLGHLGEESASAVVMDCRNGEVLAMASNPSFDPSLFDSGVSQAQWAEWTSNRGTPLINKATAGLYPPGSTFKMAVGLAALDSGKLSPSDRFFCPGYLDLGNMRFHCWRKGGHGSQDLVSALRNSCDVYFYEVARRVGIDKISETSHLLGLGTDLQLDLPGARQGMVPTRGWRIAHGKAWNLGDTIVSGIGQGYIQVTPLQLATYASRLASGRAVQPHLTRSLGGVLQPGSKLDAWPALALSDKLLHPIRQGMWAVVNEDGGSGAIARLPIPGVQMAGKTGSAQVRRVSRELREHGNFKSENLPWEYRPHALFVCYAPFDAPRYAVAVVVEHGNAGSAAAAPLARDIMIDTINRDPVNKTSPQVVQG